MRGPIRALVAGLLVGATACNSAEVLPDEAIHGEALIQGDVLLLPQAVTVVDSFLVVTDLGAKEVLVFSRRDGELVRRAGGEGEGPGEFLSPWSIQGTRDRGPTSEVWVLDSRVGRVTGYEVTAAGDLRLLGSPLSLRLPGPVMAVQWINESTFAAAGIFGEGRFLLGDTTGAVLSALGEVPLASDEVPPMAAQQALQPTAAVRPGGDRIAIAGRYASRVDIYDTSDGRMVTAAAPISFEPVMKVANQGRMPVFVSGQATRLGYVAVTCTRDRVFALFSGRIRAEYPGQAQFGRQVHVFDWSGALVGVIQVDVEAFNLAVDRPGETLYALVLDPQPAIVAFEIDPSLTRSAEEAGT